jgi:hypothetical protein
MHRDHRRAVLEFALSVGILCATFFVTTSACAADATRQDPTKQACVAANESAQDYEHARKLLAARASLAVCTAANCPSAVREDCGQRLREVDRALPTVVFAAKDSVGHDLTDVRVTMDGTPLLQKLDGSAIPVDPGVHQFVFEASGFQVNSTKVTAVIREGVKERPVQTVFELPLPPEPAAAQPAPLQSEASPPSSAGNARRAIGLAIGGAGVAELAVGLIFGAVALSTYNHALSECPGNSAQNCSAAIAPQAHHDLDSANGQATVSTIASIAGGVCMAAGAAIFFTAPKANGVEVGATTENGGVRFSLGGRW